jgi:hypothetical protein
VNANAIVPPPSQIPTSQVTADLHPIPAPEPQSTPSQDTFIATLREAPTLYNLSRIELEKLVGEVVREEGFAKLVRHIVGYLLFASLLTSISARDLGFHVESEGFFAEMRLLRSEFLGSVL